MTSPLLVSRINNGVFRVAHASIGAEEWTQSRLHDFLVDHGYTAHDAQACVTEASTALEIKIGLPD